MWVLTIGDVTMSERDMTAAEDETAFSVALLAGIPHDYLAAPNGKVGRGYWPLHCPSCLNAHAVALLIHRGGLTVEEAAQAVAAMPRDALLDCLDVPEAPPADG